MLAVLSWGSPLKSCELAAKFFRELARRSEGERTRVNRCCDDANEDVNMEVNTALRTFVLAVLALDPPLKSWELVAKSPLYKTIWRSGTVFVCSIEIGERDARSGLGAISVQRWSTALYQGDTW